MKTCIYTFALLLLSVFLIAQQKPVFTGEPLVPTEKISIGQLSTPKKFYPDVPVTPRSLDVPFRPKRIEAERLGMDRIIAKKMDNSQTPIFMEAVVHKMEKRNHLSKSSLALEVMAPAVSELLAGENIHDAFHPKQELEDELNITHIRYQQMYKGIPVFDGDYWAHIHENGKIIFNGRMRKLPVDSKDKPALSPENAIEIVKDLLRNRDINVNTIPDEILLLQERPQYTSELTWHAANREAPLRLCYHVSALPNMAQKWEYFIDAQSGEEVTHFPGRSDLYGYLSSDVKEFKSVYDEEVDISWPLNKTNFFVNGPATATATDLLGRSRPLNTYLFNNTYFMMDASRDMFVQGSIPNNPSGVIISLNGNRTSPENNTFNPVDVTSSNNTWNNRASVSLHANQMLAYDYMKNTFNRNGWDGKGGNFVGFFNVIGGNGQDFDNAFWWNRFHYYGNGQSIFLHPTCAALDVVAHELGHGVVQETAGLIYQNESGALNEMYADMHGVMTDRANWRLAEDICNPTFFKSGAMRDLSNPANGGSSLADPGWQPGHVNQQYRGSEDYGGVHINSSIPGNAMYRFAQRTSREIAERVFYRALTVYLTKSSQFIDARLGIIQAARDLHGDGQVVQALRMSFDEVGIVDGSGGNYEEDLEVNPGSDFVIAVDDGSDLLFLADGNGDDVAFPISNNEPQARVSMTDDGQYAVFVGTDNRMRLLVLDFQSGNINETILQNDPVWRNVAVSKDGTMIAGLAKEFENKIYVYSFVREQWREYTLYNIARFPGAPPIDNVVLADAIEFSHDGQYLMYDALNQVTTTQQSWDIGFLNVWDRASNNFGDGSIIKMFEGLDPSISIGNPSFTKNSPHIISFDYLDDEDNSVLFGLNLERGDLEIIFENLVLSYPSYSTDDRYLIFNAQDQSGNNVVAIQQVADDKITPVGNPSIFIPNAYWGVWFSNGERDLSTNTQEIQWSSDLMMYPNPVISEALIDIPGISDTRDLVIQVVDMLGRTLWHAHRNDWNPTGNILELGHLKSGNYILKITGNGQHVSTKFIKQ